MKHLAVPNSLNGLCKKRQYFRAPPIGCRGGCEGNIDVCCAPKCVVGRYWEGNQWHCAQAIAQQAHERLGPAIITHLGKSWLGGWEVVQMKCRFVVEDMKCLK